MSRDDGDRRSTTPDTGGIERQHTVSRVVLRGWSVQGRFGRVDLRWGTANEHTSPRAEGFDRWFVRGGRSTASEELWKSIEDKVGPAIAAVADGTIYARGQLAQALKDLVALHVVRSTSATEMWARAIQRSDHLRGLLEAIDDPVILRGHHEERTGLVAAGNEALEIERAYLLSEAERRLGQGSEAFADNLEEHLEQVRVYFTERTFEIGVAREGELLIGDSPALTVDHQRRAVGFLQGVPLNQADSLVFPLTPTLVFAGGGEPAYRDLARAAVGNVNRIQVAGAVRRVFFRPGSGLDRFALDSLSEMRAPTPRARNDDERL